MYSNNCDLGIKILKKIYYSLNYYLFFFKIKFKKNDIKYDRFFFGQLNECVFSFHIKLNGTRI